MAKGWDIDPSEFAGRVEEEVGKRLRILSMALLSEVVNRSPVGNPDIWKVNNTAYQYNNAVRDWNDALRKVPENLTKSGRLKRGLKVHDSMDIRSPAKYRAGTFKGSHLVSINGPDFTVTEHQDKNGTATKEKGRAVIDGAPNYSTVYIQTNLSYAVAIEGGHSTQAGSGVYAVSFHGVLQAHK